MIDTYDVVGVKLVASGKCLSRKLNGEVVFVDGLLPGENAYVEETKSKGKTRFAQIISISNPSSDRVVPPCIYVENGCGGCDWQHIRISKQHIYKRDIVVDALFRVGKIENAENLVSECTIMKNERYRTSARILANENDWGFRAAKSNDMIPIKDCIVLHPECVSQAKDVVKAIASETVDGTPGEEDDIHEAHVRRAPDVFCGINLNVSNKSFFQGHIDAPEVLSEIVLSCISDLGSGLVCVDLYSGVGIFAVALVNAGHKVITVEGNPYAVGDAYKNLDGKDAKVIHSDVKKFSFDKQLFGQTCDVVIADPSREGIGKDALGSVLSCDSNTIILVSCDPAAGARDISLLIDNGYELNQTIPVDMFGHTHHVEMVSILKRAS